MIFDPRCAENGPGSPASSHGPARGHGLGDLQGQGEKAARVPKLTGPRVAPVQCSRVRACPKGQAPRTDTKISAKRKSRITGRAVDRDVVNKGGSCSARRARQVGPVRGRADGRAQTRAH